MRLICSVSKVDDETALTSIANFLVDFSKNNLNDINHPSGIISVRQYIL